MDETHEEIKVLAPKLRVDDEFYIGGTLYKIMTISQNSYDDYVLHLRIPASLRKLDDHMVLIIPRYISITIIKDL